MSILEGASYEYRGWMVAIDRWSHRNSPSFLQHIPFWIKIEKLPKVYRRYHIVSSIESKMGHVDEVRIVEPILHLSKLDMIWDRVTITIDSEISLVKNVQIMDLGEPVELEFKYKKLQKFCTTCGSMRHSYDVCPKASTLTTTAGALMEIGNDPFITAQERQAAIEGLNTGQELGDSSSNLKSIPPMLAPISDYLLEHDFRQTLSDVDEGVAVVRRDVVMDCTDQRKKRNWRTLKQ